MKAIFTSLTALVLILSGVGVAQADIIGLDFTGTGAGSPGVPITAGWRFAVNSPITISSLGLWDKNADGLTSSHNVGLWNSNGTSLLASTTITNASTPVDSTSTAGRWLFNTIAPIELTLGQYVIGATFAGGDPDHFIYNGFGTPVVVSTASEVSFLGGRLIEGAALTYPTIAPPQNPGYFGPNFLIQDLSVPEPSSLCLAGLCSAIMGVYGWQRRRRAAPGSVL